MTINSLEMVNDAIDKLTAALGLDDETIINALHQGNALTLDEANQITESRK